MPDKQREPGLKSTKYTLAKRDQKSLQFPSVPTKTLKLKAKICFRSFNPFCVPNINSTFTCSPVSRSQSVGWSWARCAARPRGPWWPSGSSEAVDTPAGSREWWCSRRWWRPGSLHIAQMLDGQRGRRGTWILLFQLGTADARSLSGGQLITGCLPTMTGTIELM